MTREEVIAHIGSLSKAASIREIAHGMALKHTGRRFLPRVLQQLKKAGQIEELHGGRYRIAGAKHVQAGTSETRPKKAGRASSETPSFKRSRDSNLISGRLVAHRDGYGFVVPDEPMPKVQGDLFIPRDNLSDAMHGDRVLARIERRRHDGRAEGRIVQVVEREHPTIVGIFRYGPHDNHVLPYDTRILHEVLIPPGEEIPPALKEQLRASAVGQPVARRLRLAGT